MPFGIIFCLFILCFTEIFIQLIAFLLFSAFCGVSVQINKHVSQAHNVLTSGEDAGKTLDFILQEMNREANTILSKSTGLTGSGLEIANAAITIKAEIEKIREQVQNVE